MGMIEAPVSTQHRPQLEVKFGIEDSMVISPNDREPTAIDQCPVHIKNNTCRHEGKKSWKGR